MGRGPAALVVAAVIGGVAAGAVPARAASPTLAEMVGQRMVVAFSGTTASPRLLRRIRLGRIGGVILFGHNVAGAAQLRALTDRLQRAARAGGRPPLIICTDQEGGLVRRLPWAPPRLSARELGAAGATRVERAGLGAGRALRAAGVNLDLAPVADVPRRPDNFLLAQGRAFATDRYSVAADALAFARGLKRGGVASTYKHFPGLGRAGPVSTDDAVVRIAATADQLGRDLLPYRVAFRGTVYPVVMLSTAIYPAYGSHAAAWSRPIARTLLRRSLGFRGVTITDSLTAAAAVRGTTAARLAVRSATVGVDLLLVTGRAATSKAAYRAVLDAARSGAIPAGRLSASYTRILRFKSRF